MDVTSYLMGKKSSGGGSTSGVQLIDIPIGYDFIMNYFNDLDVWQDVTSADDMELIHQIETSLGDGSNKILRILFMETTIYPNVSISSAELEQIQITVVGNIMYNAEIDLIKIRRKNVGEDDFEVCISIIPLTTGS